MEPLLFIVMDTIFSILPSLKTIAGYEAIGEYFIGDDRDAAYVLFDELTGDSRFNENALLHMDLIETVDALPEKIRSKCCTLDQLACNTKSIIREVFRQKNLRAYEE